MGDYTKCYVETENVFVENSISLRRSGNFPSHSMLWKSTLKTYMSLDISHSVLRRVILASNLRQRILKIIVNFNIKQQQRG